jgi:hypothetical protein
MDGAVHLEIPPAAPIVFAGEGTAAKSVRLSIPRSRGVVRGARRVW